MISDRMDRDFISHIRLSLVPEDVTFWILS